MFPLFKILLPKMDYTPSERTEVIRQAYLGLFQLASLALFEKYVYFIDVYAKMKPDEQTALFNELKANEETTMLADYIKNIGRQAGRLYGTL